MSRAIDPTPVISSKWSSFEKTESAKGFSNLSSGVLTCSYIEFELRVLDNVAAYVHAYLHLVSYEESSVFEPRFPVPPKSYTEPCGDALEISPRHVLHPLGNAAGSFNHR